MVKKAKIESGERGGVTLDRSHGQRQDDRRNNPTVESTRGLTSAHAEILARSVDLDAPDHVQACREALISSGIAPYRGLADDLLQMIPTARGLRAEVAARDQEAIAARVGCATWDELRDRSLKDLLAIDTTTWRTSDRRHLEPLVRAHATLQRLKDRDWVDRDEILESLRTVPHATGQLYRARVPAQTSVLYGALRAAGHNGRIAACCLRLERALPHGPRRPARALSPGECSERQVVCLELCRLLEEDSHGLSWGWSDPREHYFQGEILFLNLPTGQISCPCPRRLSGPNFAGRWDGTHENEHRIVRWATQILMVDTDAAWVARDKEASSPTSV